MPFGVMHIFFGGGTICKFHLRQHSYAKPKGGTPSSILCLAVIYPLSGA